MKHARPDYQDRIVDLAGKIPDDEPVLLIRGQDVCALDALDAWVASAYRHGASGLEHVLLHRQAIVDWQQHHAVKVPDVPEVAG